jgi:hypothetical protein
MKHMFEVGDVVKIATVRGNGNNCYGIVVRCPAPPADRRWGSILRGDHDHSCYYYYVYWYYAEGERWSVGGWRPTSLEKVELIWNARSK